MTTVYGGNPLFRHNGKNFKSSRKPREKISVVRQKYNADLTVRHFLDGSLLQWCTRFCGRQMDEGREFKSYFLGQRTIIVVFLTISLTLKKSDRYKSGRNIKH